MKEQLDTVSIFGQVVATLFVAFFVERVASAHLGAVWAQRSR